MMEELFHTWLYSLLASGCFCSLILFLNTDSKIKPLLETACACVMVLTFVSPIADVWSTNEIDDYFRKWVTAESFNFESDTYTKSFMEAEYSAYILNEAGVSGISLKNVTVSTEQDDHGNWLPYEVHYETSATIPREFLLHIEKELGITEERQYVNGFDPPIEE